MPWVVTGAPIPVGRLDFRHRRIIGVWRRLSRVVLLAIQLATDLRSWLPPSIPLLSCELKEELGPEANESFSIWTGRRLYEKHQGEQFR